MGSNSKPIVTDVGNRPREVWSDPVGSFSWFKLIDNAITPTNGLAAGIAELAPGEGGLEHRHEQPELYYILEGVGMLSIDGEVQEVSTGKAIYIPGNSLHGVRNRSDRVLKLLYVFPADGLNDVVYRYES